MNIIVFGATGKTGLLVVSQLLSKGHQVTAYVRNAQRMNLSDANLHILENSLEDLDALKKALLHQDAVVSCLGSPNMKPSTQLTHFAKNIRSAMAETNVLRIVYMASAGVHHEIKGLSGWIIYRILGNVLKDHLGAIEQYSEPPFIFTIVRPMQLTDGPVTYKYKISTQGIPGVKSISRANVATFIVEAIDKNQYLNQSVGLSGA